MTHGNNGNRNRIAPFVGITLLAALVSAAGCTTLPGNRVNPQQSFQQGEYGAVREHLQQRIPANVQASADGNRRLEQSDRNYILARMRLALISLADGYPHDTDVLYEEIYDMLRMQGLNPDRTAMSIFDSEGGRIWKGEPFEQALSYHYVGLHYAMSDSWDNTRAALSNAMFHLRDFGTDDDGAPLDSEALIRQAAEEDDDEDFFETEYVAVESDFALGYLMSGIASQRLGRDAEAAEQFSKALAVNPALEAIVERLRDGDYDTLLVVDYGQAPRKIATGPDNTIARFVPRTASNDEPLEVALSGGEPFALPAVADINTMAQDHRWRSIEDMRQSRAEMGRTMQTAGAVTGLVGAATDNPAMQIGGLLMAAGGGAARSAAAADTRHLEYLPQRVYLVPLKLDEPQFVRVGVRGDARSAFTMPVLNPGHDGSVAVHYARLQSASAAGNTPLPWWDAAPRQYHSPHGPSEMEPVLPFILGGRCVRPPSDAVLAEYHEAGFLHDLTLDDLRELYELEGIQTEFEHGSMPGRHVLEGGRSLVAPVQGSMGYARLFRQEHAPYRPRSAEVRELAGAIRAQFDAERVQAAEAARDGDPAS